MATVIRANNRRPEIEYFLNETWAVEFEYRPIVRLIEFDLERSRQNQSRIDPLREDTVATYAAAFKRGDPFPPVICYAAARGRGQKRKLVAIDGNHRLEAALRAEEDSIDAYVVDPTTDMDIIQRMTAAFNALHGLNLTYKEKLGHALYLVDGGTSTAEAATQYGLDPKRFKTELIKVKADRKALSAGVNQTQWDGLKSSVKTRLFNLKLEEVFKDAVDLVFKAGLGSTETYDLVTRLNQATSIKKTDELLADARRMYADRIKGTAPNNSTRKGFGAKAQLGSALSNIVNLPDAPETVASMFRGDDRVAQAARIDEVVAKLAKLAAALRS
jgi:hypothetical protein